MIIISTEGLPDSFRGVSEVSMSHGSLVVDLKGTIEYASSFFCALVRVEAKRAAGMSFFDFVFPEDVEPVKKRFQAGRSPEVLPFVLKLRRTDGTSVWTAIQGQPLQTESGEVYGISAIIALVLGPVEDHPGKAAHA